MSGTTQYIMYNQSNININSIRTQDSIRKNIYTPFSNKNNTNSLQKVQIYNYINLLKNVFQFQYIKIKEVQTQFLSIKIIIIYSKSLKII